MLNSASSFLLVLAAVPSTDSLVFQAHDGQKDVLKDLRTMLLAVCHVLRQGQKSRLKACEDGTHWSLHPCPPNP